jgi:hypothetical protein
LEDYWKKKQRYEGLNNNIDWQPLYEENRSLNWNDQVILSKILSGWTATAKTMHTRGEYSDPICPLCKTEIETTTHLLQCNNEQIQEYIKETINTAINRLKKRVKGADNKKTVTDILRMYTYNDLEDMNNNKYEKAITDQQSLGEHSILNGIFHKSWRQYGIEQQDIRWLIKEIFQIRIKSWKKRNELFKKSAEDEKIKEKLLLDFDMAMDTIPSHMDQIDTERYMISKQSFLSMTTKDKKDWIMTTNGIKKKYSKRAKQGLQAFGFRIPRPSRSEIIQRQHRKRKREIEDIKTWFMNNDHIRNTTLRTTLDNIENRNEESQNQWLKNMKKLKQQYSNTYTMSLSYWLTNDTRSLDNIEKRKRHGKEKEDRGETHKKRKWKESKIKDWLTRKETPDT